VDGLSNAKRRVALTSAVGALVILVGCSGQSPTGPSTPVLTVSCATTTLTAAQQTQCSASASVPGNPPQDQTSSAQWSSSNPAVATVSAGGLVTAISPGSADITARLQTFSATRTIVVTTAAPTAVMSVRISATSSYGLTVALQDVSTVTFDVSGSAGIGLSYRLAYGDGVIDTNPMTFPHKGTWFDHRYHALGTFAAQLTVTDSQGRQASTNASVTVKNLTATWGNVIRNPSNGLTESRLLTLIQGPATGGGASLTGTYTHPAGNREPVTGTVEDTGTIRNLAVSSGAITFSGNTLDGNGVSPDASSLKLIVKGGSADGLTLTFSRQ
jgi:hypothetical protein